MKPKKMSVGLYVRHTIGSRLLCEPTEYQIVPVDNGWEISFILDNGLIEKRHDSIKR
ncbi:hypothetical protein J2Y03_005198 [Neobacillus niacini]|uniref:hypothetical protein n=1 Tax=Neobacillus niacini TaxID=86668 RepID=UPI00285F6F87|nr:hypothetical protein [Neobacillus niacini]MDR7080138.1 hypothetical protein [Neobacillus niacini]